MKLMQTILTLRDILMGNTPEPVAKDSDRTQSTQRVIDAANYLSDVTERIAKATGRRE
jgi:hypothetical protein